MEDCRNEGYLEDYSLTQTTLDEVFVRFVVIVKTRFSLQQNKFMKSFSVQYVFQEQHFTKYDMPILKKKINYEYHYFQIRKRANRSSGR